jgi:hypothetical protein
MSQLRVFRANVKSHISALSYHLFAHGLSSTSSRILGFHLGRSTKWLMQETTSGNHPILRKCLAQIGQHFTRSVSMQDVSYTDIVIKVGSPDDPRKLTYYHGWWASLGFYHCLSEFLPSTLQIQLSGTIRIGAWHTIAHRHSNMEPLSCSCEIQALPHHP